MNVKRKRRYAFGRRKATATAHLRPPVMRIAHRGASGLAPENTLASVKRALEIGVDLVEIDIHLTADGYPVVIHDRMVDRTTDGTGLISTMTLAQVKELDAGSWFGAEFRGEQIPTLEEVMLICRRKALVLVETKTVESAEAAAVLMRSMRAQSRVVIQSFHGAAVRSVNRLDRRIPTAFLMTGSEATLRRRTGVVRRVLKLGANALSLKYRAAQPDLVAQFLACAMGFWVWTVDEEADMRAMIEMGVGGIITNYPDRLNRILEEG
jgi:glycerophosphoryl diester phosphodiesterase